jgi:hypothetical protein
MMKAVFLVNGEARETREVEDDWLERAEKTQENVLLSDGNPYRVVRVEYDAFQGVARVELEPPQFQRAS